MSGNTCNANIETFNWHKTLTWQLRQRWPRERSAERVSNGAPLPPPTRSRPPPRCCSARRCQSALRIVAEWRGCSITTGFGTAEPRVRGGRLFGVVVRRRRYPYPFDARRCARAAPPPRQGLTPALSDPRTPLRDCDRLLPLVNCEVCCFLF